MNNYCIKQSKGLPLKSGERATRIYKEFKENSRDLENVIGQLSLIENTGSSDLELIHKTIKEIVAFTIADTDPEVYNYNYYDIEGNFVISFDVNSETGHVVVSDNDVVYYKIEEEEERINRNVIFNSLYSCSDLRKDEVKNIIEITDTIETEYVENKGDDNDSYHQHTFYDSNGEDIVTFEVYINRDYVNLLEYRE